MGRSNISGIGVSWIAALYLFLLRMTAVLFIMRVVSNNSPAMIIVVKTIYYYLLLSFVYSYFLFPTSYQDRELVLLFQSDSGNSVNYINCMVMVLVLLYLINDRNIFIRLFLLLISVIWGNRTGMILTPLILIVHHISNFSAKNLF